MATRGGAPKKFFFYENALSGSIHSTYQLPSLQTDQKPTLGQPNCHITILRYLAILRIVLDIRGFVSVGLLHNAGQVIKTNVSQLKLLTFLTQFKLVTLSHGPAQQCTSEEKQEI